MQDRNYYTFIELLMALREEYQKSQKLLHNMKEDIRITDNIPCNYDLILCNSSYARSESEVILHVNKDYHSGVGPYIRHLLKNSSRMELYWDKDHALYTLRKDDKYYFDKTNSDEGYNPNVTIPDFLQKDFDNNYQKLKALDLYKLPEIVVYNQQNISIDGRGILFTNVNSNYDISSIYYNAKEDKIYVHSHQLGKVWGIHYRDLFNTEIPCYKIPKEYLEFLEKANPKEYGSRNIVIDDYIKKCGKFSMEEKEEQLILKKTLNKK